ncbi:hypothetical protein R1sor_003191 [Riccia sorocarpa]|uniref:Uncharacterized protein n=1 Tax=Riccia sorocarpa TaxID=122646 RepID=A0ABD3H3P2_9MARC
MWQGSKAVGTTTAAKKSTLHFAFDSDNGVLVSSTEPIQPMIEYERGMIRRASRIHPTTIQTVVRNAPIERKNIRTNTFPAKPTATLLQSRGGRTNQRSRTSVTPTLSPTEYFNSRTNHEKITGKGKRASEVQPVGQHVLLKRFTATSKAIDPLASRSTRSYKSFARPNLNNKFSRVGTSSARNVDTRLKSSRDFEYFDLNRERNTAATSGSDKNRPSNVDRPEAPLEVENTHRPSNVDDAENLPDLKEPESVSDVQQQLLDKFSAKAIDAAIRFTPSESSSSSQPISDQRLLKKFYQRAINAAISPTPFPVASGNNAMSPDSSFQFDSNSNTKTPDPEEKISLEERAEITSQQTPEKVSKSNWALNDRSSSYDTTRGSEAGLEQPAEAPTKLLQNSAKAMERAAKSIPFVGSQLAEISDMVTDSSNASFEPESKPVEEPQQGFLEENSTAETFGALKSSSTARKAAARDLNGSSQGFRRRIPRRAEARIAEEKYTPSSAETDSTRSSSSSSSLTKEAPDLEVLQFRGLLRNFSPESFDAVVQQPTSLSEESPNLDYTDSKKGTRSSSSSNSSFTKEEPDQEMEKVQGFLKELSPEATDAAVQQLTSQSEQNRNLENSDSKKDLGYEANDSNADSPTPSVYLRESNTEVNPAPSKLFGPRPKKGGVLDTNEPKLIRICALGIPGHILYLEVYKDFIDLLLNLLTMRTGAVIKLLHEVDACLDFGGYGGGILNIYDSLSRMDESILTNKKETLLNPNHKQNLTKELKCLGSFEPECCNSDCPKFVSSSRIVCKNCTIATHFTCSICNAYFRENVHSTACISPWRPWGLHASAAPVLTRYTVLQSVDAIVAPKSKKLVSRDGFVKPGVPFMITNDLNIKQLTTQSIAKILKTVNFEEGGTEELDCHELLIGKTEVVFLLGAAMTSLTPLTDVFAHLCTSENKISANETLSRTASASEELSKQVSSIARPIGDLMTYIRPLASGFMDVLQQGTGSAVTRFSDSPEVKDSTVNGGSSTTNNGREFSPITSSTKVSSVSTTRKKSSLHVIPQVSILAPPSTSRNRSTSAFVTPQDFIPGTDSATALTMKSSVSATPQNFMSEASEATGIREISSYSGLATAKESIPGVSSTTGGLEAAEMNISVSTATQEKPLSAELREESHQTSASCCRGLCNKMFGMRGKNKQ